MGRNEILALVVVRETRPIAWTRVYSHSAQRKDVDLPSAKEGPKQQLCDSFPPSRDDGRIPLDGRDPTGPRTPLAPDETMQPVRPNQGGSFGSNCGTWT